MMSTRRSLFTFGLLLAVLALNAPPAIAQEADQVIVTGSVMAEKPATGTKYNKLTLKWTLADTATNVDDRDNLGFLVFYTTGSKAVPLADASDAEKAAAERKLDAHDELPGVMKVDAGKPTKRVVSSVGGAQMTDFEYTLRGLKQDTLYAVTVLAYNDLAKQYATTGDESAIVTGSATTAPVAPSRVRSVELTPADKMLTVMWQRPTNTGGSTLTIAGYEVQHRTSQTARDLPGTWTKYPPAGGAMLTVMKYDITGLLNDVMYDVQVRAVNSASGKGPWEPIDMAGLQGTPTDDPDAQPTTTTTPALPFFGILALLGGLLAAGRARLRR
jgi:hypothetical protein